MTTIPDYRLEPPKLRKPIPTCPMCGESLYDYLIEDVTGDIVGCSECTRFLTAEEYLDLEAFNED